MTMMMLSPRRKKSAVVAAAALVAVTLLSGVANRNGFLVVESSSAAASASSVPPPKSDRGPRRPPPNAGWPLVWLPNKRKGGKEEANTTTADSTVTTTADAVEAEADEKGKEKEKPPGDDSSSRKESSTEEEPKRKEKKKSRMRLKLPPALNPFRKKPPPTSDAAKDGTKADEPKEPAPAEGTSAAEEETSNPLAKVDPSQNATTAIPPSSSNVTSPAGQQQQQQQGQGPPAAGGLLVIGSPTGPRYYRRPIVPAGPGGLVVPADLQQQQQQQHRHPLSQNGMLLVELFASVLGTVTRLWMLRWLTGWLAKQEEVIQPAQHFAFERLNDRYVRDAAALRTAVQSPPDGVGLGRWKRRHVRRVQGRAKPSPVDLARLFARTSVVVELRMDSRDGPDNEYLSDIVSFLLQQHRQRALGVHKESLEPMELEVVFLVQSPGGSVASFGLAAAQVRRLARESGITTTVCVDKYAASGGYMIASQAHRLVAAPFASVGSVGVIMEGLNFNELARKHGIQPLVIKAGDSKNPFTTWGAVSRRDVEVEKESLEKVHVAFKDLIVEGRPVLKDNIGEIADGSVFLGSEALGLDMVDRVMTSSEYIQERVEAGDRVLKLHRSNPVRFPQRRGGISPIDILPHLRTWVTTKMGGGGGTGGTGGSNAGGFSPSWLVQAGGALGFIHHVYSQYFR